jgi:hypothetical protein
LLAALANEGIMEHRSLPKRAFKYALTSSAIIMVLVLYSILTQGAVGSLFEIAMRLVITTFCVFFAMWLVFIGYLFFNPDADSPRNGG